MKSFLVALGAMLHEFMTSKKVLAAVLAVVADAITKDPVRQQHIVEIGVTLIVSIMAADHGKAKVMAATIAASAPSPAPATETMKGSAS